jgi:WS/DGAT/MGAT family acyltransferase
MAVYTFERLSAQDAGFLWAETPNQPMHVGAVALFDASELRREGGGIDIERYRSQVESVLHWIPRYRQKIQWTPIERWPVWVDDRNFDLGHHIRHIALPAPGSPEQLQELVGRINARRLDRRHALWECWLIEGVAGGEQFAILNKIHHCMIDGAAGADLSQILMSPSPRFEERAPVPYMPRPHPRRSELAADSLARSVGRPLGLARSMLRRWASSEAEREARGEAREASLADRLRAFAELADHTLAPSSATPLNGQVGPHRRFEWLTMPLDDVRELRRELGCTVNDVVLGTVTGAVRRYLFRRRVDVRRIEFRVSAPVSMRRPEHDPIQGNHVSSWVVRLPLEIEDPVDQVLAVHTATESLKAGRAALAVDSIMELAEWVPGPVLERLLPSIQNSGPVNMIVTNVPGPQFPLYLAGTKLLAMYPIVPLLPGSGLGVALFSYEGKLCWGFNADDELVPDIGYFVEDVRASFEALRKGVVERYLARRTKPAPEPAPAEAAEAGSEGPTEVEESTGRASPPEAEGPIELASPPEVEGPIELASRRDADADAETDPGEAPVASEGADIAVGTSEEGEGGIGTLTATGR